MTRHGLAAPAATIGYRLAQLGAAGAALGGAFDISVTGPLAFALLALAGAVLVSRADASRAGDGDRPLAERRHPG